MSIKKESIYNFAAVVDKIECMDDECVIFDVTDDNHIPTRHCFVKNELLAEALIVITPEKELDISARFVPEKNCMDVIEIKDPSFAKERTIVTKCTLNPVDSHCYLYQVQNQIAEPFEILLNNTPATLSRKCTDKTLLLEGKKYEFTYIKKANRLEVTKIACIDDLFERENFLLSFITRRLTTMNYLYDEDDLTEDEKKINSLRCFVDLCVTRSLDSPGMIVDFTGTVCEVTKAENGISFNLELSNEVEYKCIIIKSQYSNSFIRVQEGKRYYISGILSGGVVYVLISHRLRSVNRKRKTYPVLKQNPNDQKEKS